MRVRWGFVGAGWIARAALAPAVHAANGAVLQAVAARDVERARSLGPAGRAYDDYAAVVSDPTVDAVYVALHNDAHLPWVLAALDAGKHVLCEKPLGMSAAEVEQMTAAAAAADRLLVEATWSRWHPRTRRASALLRSGALGAVQSVDAGFVFDGVAPDNYRLRPEHGGGALYDLGAYALGAPLWVMPDAEPVVTSATAAVAPTGVDLTTDVTLALGEAAAHVRCSVAEADSQWLRVEAEGGRLELSDPVFTSRWAVSTMTVHDVAGQRVEQFAPVDPYQLMVEHVGRALRGDSDAWVLPLAESLRVARATDAVFATAGLPR